MDSVNSQVTITRLEVILLDGQQGDELMARNRTPFVNVSEGLILFPLLNVNCSSENSVMLAYWSSWYKSSCT